MLTKAFLTQCTAQYDSKKGYFKQFGLRSDDTDIQKLSEFISRLPSDLTRLNPEHLLELTHIVLAKDLSQESASCLVFREIAQKLGGEDHLKALQHCDKLTIASIALLSECTTEQQRDLTMLLSDIDSNTLNSRYEFCLALGSSDNLTNILSVSLNFTPDELKRIQSCCQDHTQSEISNIINAINYINEQLIYIYAPLNDESYQEESRAYSLELYIQAFKLLSEAFSTTRASSSIDTMKPRSWDDGESLLNGSSEENEFYLSDLITKLTQVPHEHICSFKESLELLKESDPELLNVTNIKGLWQFLDISTLNIILIKNSPISQSFLNNLFSGKYDPNHEVSERFEEIELSESITQVNSPLSQLEKDHQSSAHILPKSMSDPCGLSSKKNMESKIDDLAQHKTKATQPKSPRPKAIFILFNETDQQDRDDLKPSEFIQIPI